MKNVLITILKVIAVIIIAVVLAIVTSLISACGEPQDEIYSDASNEEAALDDGLGNCLDEIADSVEVGTAGSTLKAVPVAAKLLQWAVSTEMTEDDIAAAVGDKLNSMSDSDKEIFLLQMDLIDDMYKMLTSGDQQDMLASAGVEDGAESYDSDAIAAMEALMTAVGLR